MKAGQIYSSDTRPRFERAFTQFGFVAGVLEDFFPFLPQLCTANVMQDLHPLQWLKAKVAISYTIFANLVSTFAFP